VKSVRHTIQVDYVEFMDELGDMIDCVARPLRTFFTISPSLAYQMIFGQVTSYQYRIRGPHPWKGAIEAALSVDERVNRGTLGLEEGRPLPVKKRGKGVMRIVGMILVAGIVYAIYLAKK